MPVDTSCRADHYCCRQDSGLSNAIDVFFLPQQPLMTKKASHPRRHFLVSLRLISLCPAILFHSYSTQFYFTSSFVCIFTYFNVCVCVQSVCVYKYIFINHNDPTLVFGTAAWMRQALCLFVEAESCWLLVYLLHGPLLKLLWSRYMFRFKMFSYFILGQTIS